MKATWVVLAMVLFGCAPEYDVVCESEVVGLLGGHADMHCARTDYNLRLTRRMMIEAGVATEEQWNSKMKPWSVWVSSEWALNGKPKEGEIEIDGIVSYGPQLMRLERGTIAMFHEVLHVMQGPGHGHDNWDKNGFNELIEQYEHYYFGDSPEFDIRFGRNGLPEWYYEEVPDARNE